MSALPQADGDPGHPPCLSCADPSLVFVFGSNRLGRHGGGAAAHAVRYHGAIPGRGHGRQGQSYAIDTMTDFETIRREVRSFLEYARASTALRFFVTALGCGIAGYTPEQIAPLFADAPENCLLPEGWRK